LNDVAGRETPFSSNKANAKAQIHPMKFTDAGGQAMSYSMSYFGLSMLSCFHKSIDFIDLK
jgi:hypothetical protein